MGQIFVVMGKSATGKDTIYKKLVQQKKLALKTVALFPITTNICPILILTSKRFLHHSNALISTNAFNCSIALS